jgi:AcrR family transcriptional regulator
MLRARTEEAKDKRRLALMTAALDEFFEKGFSAARMDDIAKRAGLSKGAIYLYFDSKEALFTSLVDAFAIPNIERIEQAAEAAGSAMAAIEAMMRLAPVFIRETPVPKIMKILIADAPAFPEMVTAYRKKVVERVLGAITNALKKAKENGEIDIGDPALTARLVVAPIVMSGIWRILFEHDPKAKVDLEALFALHEQILKRALAA